jgi:paraquat-inducible protein B
MQSDATSRIIGLFVIGALLIVSIGVFWLLGDGWSQKPYRVMVTFPESVKGLDVGSKVTFQGVRLGSVASVDVVVSDSGQVTIPVILEINQALRGSVAQADQDIPQTIELFLKRGLVAQLIPESLLTGLQQIQLSFRPQAQGYTLKGEYDYPQIPTVPSQLDKVSNMVEAVANRIESLPIETLLTNLNQLIVSTDARVASPQLTQSLTKLESTLTHFASVMQTIDHRIDPILTRADESFSSLQTAGLDVSNTADRMTVFTDELDVTVDEMEVMINQIKAAANTYEELARPGAPLQRELLSTLHRFNLMAEQFRQLAETLQRNPEAILSGKQG